MDCSELFIFNLTNTTTFSIANISNTNDTIYIDQLPDFSLNVLIQVIAYCILFLIAAAGNLTVLITLIRGRHRKSRISLMIMHLTIADLIVTFIMIPLEIGWRITVQWTAGNIACKVFTVLRAFGLYLSSNVLVCVSMDRYFAIIHPLRVTDARRRGKIMLAIAWTFSFLCASPQSVVFHVIQHPSDPSFYQCVTFHSFSTQSLEMSYNLFCVSVMYFMPLLVIIFAYSCILIEISTKSRETKEDNKEIRGRDSSTRGRMRLRRSDMSNIARARSRTLRMTITIVAAFIWCWTPYVIMTLWYTFDRGSARKVDDLVQDALFIMAVSNSCMNPIVYGSYAMNLRKDCLCLGNKYTSQNNLNRRSTSVHGFPYNVIDCKQENTFLRVRSLMYRHAVRSTATTRTTTCQTFHPSRFTFNTHNDKTQVIGSHSEAYISADDDSGVSISYRGRPYHSEPPVEGAQFELAFFRSDSLQGTSPHQGSTNMRLPNNHMGNEKLISFTISNMAFLKENK